MSIIDRTGNNTLNRGKTLEDIQQKNTVDWKMSLTDLLATIQSKRTREWLLHRNPKRT